MKNLIAAVLVFVSFNAFGQNDFVGTWAQPYSDYLLIIENDQNIALYNPHTLDIYYQAIVSINENEIIIHKSFNDNSYYNALYQLTDNNQIYCNLDNEVELIYTRIEN